MGAMDGWSTAKVDGVVVSAVSVSVVAGAVVSTDGLSEIVGVNDVGGKEIDGAIVSPSRAGVGFLVSVGFLVISGVGALVTTSRLFFGGMDGDGVTEGASVVDSSSSSSPVSSDMLSTEDGLIVGLREVEDGDADAVSAISAVVGATVVLVPGSSPGNINTETSHHSRSCTPGKSVVAISASVVLPVPKYPLSPFRKHPLVAYSPT